MTRVATTHVGPLGSTFHVLRADPATVAALAAVDWNRSFRRVCLDPVRGLITLMAPSHRHEDLTWIFDDLVETAGVALAGAARRLRSPRLRGRDEPPGTRMEPDCAFYVFCRGLARGFAQPFAYRVSIRSRWLANDCRSLLLSAGGPPVCIPLDRKVSMKSRMLRRWRMVSVE